jgi:hypothetical protein
MDKAGGVFIYLHASFGKRLVVGLSICNA